MSIITMIHSLGIDNIIQYILLHSHIDVYCIIDIG